MEGHTEFAKKLQVGQISRYTIVQCNSRNRNLRPAMNIQVSGSRDQWYMGKHEILGGAMFAYLLVGE